MEVLSPWTWMRSPKELYIEQKGKNQEKDPGENDISGLRKRKSKEGDERGTYRVRAPKGIEERILLKGNGSDAPERDIKTKKMSMQFHNIVHHWQVYCYGSVKTQLHELEKTVKI